MNPMVHTITLLSAGAAGALLAAIWQGALLAGAVMIGLRLLPGLSAAARSVIWLNVFILLILLHVVPALAAPAGVSSEHFSGIHLDLRWSLAIAGAWVVLSMVRAVQLTLGALHLHRLVRRGTPVAVEPELQALLAAAGGRAAELCVSNEVARPSVVGFFRPRILMPPELVEALTPAELRQVVLHELEHLRRADDWTNLIQKFGLVLFPLNPVLLWVERRLCAERELACDDRVISASAGRKAYALCLTRLAEFSLLRRSFSLVLGAWERRPELVRRVHRILQQPGRTMGRRPAMFATGSLLSGALGCALMLAHSPQLIRFTPAGGTLEAQALPLPDAREMARELGGTPQLVKATLPSRHAEISGQNEGQVHKAMVKHAFRRRAVNERMAALDRPAILGRRDPAPAPSSLDASKLDDRSMVVLTAFRTFTAPRVVMAISPDHRTATQIVIPAIYAVVATPEGWLVIQI